MKWRKQFKGIKNDTKIFTDRDISNKKIKKQL